MKRSALIAILTIALAIQLAAQHHRSTADVIRPESSGPMATATVTFGAWMSHPRTCTTPPCAPLDRFQPGGNAQAYNHHSMIPELVTIRAGGTVNFNIGGFHVLAIYDDGTQPADIDVSIIQPPTVPGGPPRVPAIINDATNRLYRGLDPVSLPIGALRPDRVENFRFDRPGVYLVICAIVSHFQEGMYGYVRVLPAN